jgi:hypothetical protein
LKSEFDDVDNNQKTLNLNQTATTSASEDENPVYKFNKIKSEIEMIEKDLQFYSHNVKIKFYETF